MKCKVAICARESRAKGLCMAHYRRLNVRGDLEENLPLRKSNLGLSFRERFEETYMPVPESGCWIWMGFVDHNGYGVIAKTHTEKLAAHRASYEFYRGPIPEGLLVCHKCDVRSCVNPEHLFLGTIQDNHLDMKLKGRGPRGEKSGVAKLTEVEVREIRASKETRRVLAERFKISRSHVAAIKRKIVWTHIS